jgi:hypothetical protein
MSLRFLRSAPNLSEVDLSLTLGYRLPIFSSRLGHERRGKPRLATSGSKLPHSQIAAWRCALCGWVAQTLRDYWPRALGTFQ